MSCGQTHSSPSSSRIQCPLSQLQHSRRTRELTFLLWGGVSRLTAIMLHQRRKRQLKKCRKQLYLFRPGNSEGSGKAYLRGSGGAVCHAVQAVWIKSNGRRCNRQPPGRLPQRDCQQPRRPGAFMEWPWYGLYYGWVP